LHFLHVLPLYETIADVRWRRRVPWRDVLRLPQLALEVPPSQRQGKRADVWPLSRNHAAGCAWKATVSPSPAARKGPAKHRDEAKHLLKDRTANTFEKIAREWHANKVPTWRERTAKNILQRLEADIFPCPWPQAHRKHRDVIATLCKFEERAASEVAHRQKAVCSQIFSYAIQCGLTGRNLVADMKDVLKTVRTGHFAAIDADELPQFLSILDRNEARMFAPTRIALRLMLLCFVRTSELIETPWSEIDLERGNWIIPWQRMKRSKLTVNPDMINHHVCLSRQALELLRELHTITGRSKHLFPNQRDHP
jgi:integrase